jgi:hypothetical protein
MPLFNAKNFKAYEQNRLKNSIKNSHENRKTFANRKDYTDGIFSFGAWQLNGLQISSQKATMGGGGTVAGS